MQRRCRGRDPRTGPSRSGRHGSWRPLLFLATALLIVLAAPSARAVSRASLQQITDLGRAGAWQLALHRMDQLQPDPQQDAADWMQWERERLYILQRERNWAGIVARVENLPAGLPNPFVRWARTREAEAQLQRRDAPAARRVLRRLLWAGDGKAGEGPERRQFAQWRRMVVRSYLLDGQVGDARIALARYQQDYGEHDGGGRLLEARVALQSGHPAEAWQVLRTDGDLHARALYLLARLRDRAAGADAVYRAASVLAAKAEDQPRVQAQLWTTAALAAQQADAPRNRIRALEHALAVAPHLPSTGPFVVSADALWRAYLSYGHALGNSRELLVGQDDRWYFAATDAIKKTPVRARALFAVLALSGSNPKRREMAHDYLASMISRLPHGGRLLSRLYLDAGRFSDPASLPTTIRYRLVDIALQRNNLELASRLMAGLSAPPTGTDPVDWQLRRARVQIRVGHGAEGARLLARILKDGKPLDKAHRDRFVQVIFDLQTAGDHRAAIDLLKALLAGKLQTQERRELLFWMADSYNALHRYGRAGRLYLQSAILGNPFAMDAWAQTARFHAAQALARAGFTGDARRLYQGLLNATHDASRRTVLRHKIQRLTPSAPSGASVRADP